MTLEGSAEDKKGLFLTGCYLNESKTSLGGSDLSFGQHRCP